MVIFIELCVDYKNPIRLWDDMDILVVDFSKFISFSRRYDYEKFGNRCWQKFLTLYVRVYNEMFTKFYRDKRTFLQLIIGNLP